MPRVIVSGANGFIGSSLVRRLLTEGFEVHALVHTRRDRLDAHLPQASIHPLSGPASVADIVTRIEPDTIFHLATVNAEPSPENLARILDANITLGASLLVAAAQCKRPPAFVNTGTYWQFDSTFAYAPNTYYAATKQAFADLLQFHRDRMHLPAVTLILYDTFGEEDTRPKLWHHILSSAPGAAVPLTAGEQTIHLLHINDVLDAFLRAHVLLHQRALQQPVYTVHALQPRTLRALIEELDAKASLKLDLRWGAIPYRDSQIFEPCVGEPLPGWSPRIDVVSSLLAMANASRAAASGHPIAPERAAASSERVQ